VTVKKVNKRRLAQKKRNSKMKGKKDVESLTNKEKKIIEKEKTMLESIEPFSFKVNFFQAVTELQIFTSLFLDAC
jgi:hypothetical protein